MNLKRRRRKVKNLVVRDRDEHAPIILLCLERPSKSQQQIGAQTQRRRSSGVILQHLVVADNGLLNDKEISTALTTQKQPCLFEMAVARAELRQEEPCFAQLGTRINGDGLFQQSLGLI